LLRPLLTKADDPDEESQMIVHEESTADAREVRSQVMSREAQSKGVEASRTLMNVFNFANIWPG